MKLLQRWKNTALHNKALVLTSVLVAFGTIFYASAAGYQVWLLVESGRHSDEQLGRVIDNANWLARSADAAEKQLEQSILQESSNAKSTIGAAQEQMRLDQRAWVGATAINVVAVEGQPLRFDILYTNSGKTIAREVSEQSNWKVAWTKDKFVATYPPGGPQSYGVLQPGAHVTSTAKVDYTLNNATLSGIKNGTVRAYVYGFLTYVDVFHRKHFSKFCGYVDPENTGLVTACKQYNDAD